MKFKKNIFISITLSLLVSSVFASDNNFKETQSLALLGDSNKQYQLGFMYESGQGIQKNDTKAFEWYKKAATQGNPSAQFNLGVMYLEGRGTEKDDDKAFESFSMAAIQGLDVAQFNLGVMYTEGRGVEKNEVKASEWYNRAAEQGIDITHNFGVMYDNVQGLRKDDAKAFELYKKNCTSSSSKNCINPNKRPHLRFKLLKYKKHPFCIKICNQV